MTFTYPAVFTPHKEDKGFHAYFPDLECCEADGPDLEDAVENARDEVKEVADIVTDINDNEGERQILDKYFK